MTKPLQQAFSVFQDFVSLIYPRLCMACMANAPVRGEHMCMACQIDLPYTDQHRHRENTFTDRLWGRFPLQTASSQLLMIKGGITENIIYNIKYKNATALATSLGRSYGWQLIKSPLYQDVDVIVPVPIHHSKLKTRGYNQSTMYAEGIAEAMEIPMLETGLKKLRNTTSQTRKSRMERLMNVEGEYAVQGADHLKGKHVLLVDDVMTTGATLEARALEILKVADTKVSIVTIALKND